LLKKLNDDILQFFRSQGAVIVNTLDAGGSIHSSCKGIVKIDHDGIVYLLDVYRGRTFENLKHNHNVTITAVDEHKFIGYCLKGKARIMPQKELDAQIMQAWESGITARLARRLIKNIREEKGYSRHPEALLPKPEYLIVVKVQEVLDLTPHKLK
jgi:general stress protein 26